MVSDRRQSLCLGTFAVIFGLSWFTRRQIIVIVAMRPTDL